MDADRALQERLTAHAVRALAAPLGRGALTLGTRPPPPAAPLTIPPLVMAGALEGGAGPTIALDVASVPPAPARGAANELTAWAEFHNGVAAGLALHTPAADASSATDDRAWLAGVRPSSPTYAHGGLLLGAGLRGRLASLSSADVFRALATEHPPTALGLLLGVSASRLGTCHAATARALFLHVPTRHPAGHPDLELPPPLQAAALVGAGLLHLGSGHAPTAAALADEVGRRPAGGAPPPPPPDGAPATRDQTSAEGEAYSLAAGLALGMTCLARGRGPGGGGDALLARLAARLGAGGAARGDGNTRAADADARAAAPAAAAAAPPPPPDAGAPVLVLEGRQPNIVATTPGAAAALGLIYLRSNDAAVVSLLAPPATPYELTRIRPDLAAVRTLARALVLWDGISPDSSWVAAQLPRAACGSLSSLQASQDAAAAAAAAGRRPPPGPDLEAAALAHVSALAGGGHRAGGAVRWDGVCCCGTHAARVGPRSFRR